MSGKPKVQAHQNKTVYKPNRGMVGPNEEELLQTAAAQLAAFTLGHDNRIEDGDCYVLFRSQVVKDRDKQALQAAFSASMAGICERCAEQVKWCASRPTAELSLVWCLFTVASVPGAAA